MLHALAGGGLFPRDVSGQKYLEALDPWILRSRALNEALEPFEIGRALFHLQQRRGFKSNRKTDGDETGAMFDAIENARDHMQAAGARTLGELLGKPRIEQLKLNSASARGDGGPLPQARVRAGKDGSKMVYSYYPSRAMILDEFEQIWAAQAPHHRDLLTTKAHDALRYVLEHQRDLKPQDVGKCTFMPDQPRAPRALPSAQYLRILQEVNNLTVGAVGEVPRILTSKEREQVIGFLASPTSKSADRTFKSIRKLLSLPESQKFNIEFMKRMSLQGDMTAGALMQESAWGREWFGFSRSQQDAIVLKLLDTEQEKDLVRDLVAEYGISEHIARGASRVRFADSHVKLSAMAIGRLIPHLEKGLRYDEAATAEFGDHRALGDGEIHEEELPYYGEVLSRHTAFERSNPQNVEEQYGRIANPTVHVALNELRKVINDIIKRWGPPTEVVLELARDLPLSDRGLKELESTQKKNQDLNDKRRVQLEELKVSDSYENRLKLRLFEEAEEAFGGTVVCVFSGNTISRTALFTDSIQVEHVLPISRTLDDSFSNKVLATREANSFKGNRTPYEAFGSDPLSYDWEQIGLRAASLPKGKARRFAPDAMEDWEAYGGGFLARQLNDTRYIARLGKSFVEALFGGQGAPGQKQSVWVVPGQLTADLRHHAGFNTLTGLTGGNRKDRTDHRHHAIDALVVALTDRSTIKLAADLAKREDRAEHYEMMAVMAEPLKRYRRAAEDRLAKLIVSHKPDHGFQDAMHNDTAYGLTRRSGGKDKQILVTRKSLSGMDKPADLERIADDRLRELFQNETEGLTGKDFNAALVSAGASLRPKVHSVRIHDVLAEKSFVTITHGKDGEHSKAYKGDGNYCYDIFLGPKGKWTGEVITTFQAYQMAQTDRDWWKKPVGRAGQPVLMRIRKGDMLEIDISPENRRVCVVSYVTPGMIALYPHFEANADARTRKSYKGDGPLKYVFKAPSTLQKAHAKLVTVSPAGTVTKHTA